MIAEELKATVVELKTIVHRLEKREEIMSDAISDLSTNIKLQTNILESNKEAITLEIGRLKADVEKNKATIKGHENLVNRGMGIFAVLSIIFGYIGHLLSMVIRSVMP